MNSVITDPSYNCQSQVEIFHENENLFVGAKMTLIRSFGRTAATFLNQINYWITNNKCSGKIFDGQKWIYNTEEEWGNQIGLSARQIRRHVAKFVKLGIIAVKKLSNRVYDRTNYITICYDKLCEFLEGNNQKFSSFLEKKHELLEAEQDKVTLSGGQNVPMSLHILPTNNKSYKSNIREEKNFLSEEKEEENFWRKQKSEYYAEKTFGVFGKKAKAPSNTTCQDMLKTWNELLWYKAETKLSPYLARQLVAAYQRKFDNSHQKWREFCELIKFSPIMGSERFNLRLLWAIKFERMDKIILGWLSGDYNTPYYLQKRARESAKRYEEISIKERVPANEEMVYQVDSLPEDEKFKKIRRDIIKSLGGAVYKSLFHYAKFVVVDGVLTMVGDNKYAEKLWDERYSELVYKIQKDLSRMRV